MSRLRVTLVAGDGRRSAMRAHQIMARHVITVGTETSILDAAKLMMDHHISGLPVVDASGRLVGILSESDFFAAKRDRHATPAWPLVSVPSRLRLCSRGLRPRA